MQSHLYNSWAEMDMKKGDLVETKLSLIIK